MFGVSDYMVDRVLPGIPQPAEWQRIGDQIDAALIFARRTSARSRIASLLKKCRKRRRHRQSSVSHMCAPMKTNADYSESEEIAWRRK